MKRAALYARVSTEQQIDKDSIPAQVTALKEYAEKHQYVIIGIYVDDGVSGTKLNERDELQHLLTDVKAGKIDIVLFTKLDRWFRSVRHYLNTQEILDKQNVPWKAIWEHYETETPQGRLMVTQMLAFAEFEAGNTSLRINKVFDYKKTKREALSGKIPYGYQIVDKHIVPDPEKAEIARKAFKTYIDTGNMCETLRRVQGNGMPTTQRGFKCMLQNRKYIGEAYGDDEYIEPIIDRQTFDEVQRMLKMNLKPKRVYTYVFSGLVWCSDCGRKMTGTTDEYKAKKIRYKLYRCMYHYRPVPTCGCTVSLNESKLEKYLVKNLEELSFESLQEKGSVNTDDIVKQIEGEEKRLSRLKELYVNGLIGLDEYKHDAEDYRGRIADLKKQLGNYTSEDKDALKQLVGANLADWYWTLSEDEKRSLWRSVISKIWYGSDKNLRVEFR